MKLAIVIAAAAAALVAVSTVDARPGNNVATGHGTIPRFAPFVASVRFAAEGSPDGSAHGFYTQTLSTPGGPSVFGGFTGDVTCLDVLTGDTAIIGGVVTETTDPRFTAGFSFWVSARDGHDTDTPDTASFVFLSDMPAVEFGPDFPSRCDAPFFVNPFGLIPVISGQITVGG